MKWCILHKKEGVNIPTEFAEKMLLSSWTGIDHKDIEICKQGPENPEYQQAWDNIFQNARNEYNKKLSYSKEGDLEVWDLDEDPDQEYDNWGDEIIREEYTGTYDDDDDDDDDDE